MYTMLKKEVNEGLAIVTIDRPEGIDIDQCEQVSRGIDPQLDAKEFSDLPAYTLCVSSAGLERRLKKPEHFEQFMGESVTVGLYKPMDGMKLWDGKLVGYDEGNVTLDLGGSTRVFEAKEIAAVRLRVEF